MCGMFFLFIISWSNIPYFQIIWQPHFLFPEPKKVYGFTPFMKGQAKVIPFDDPSFYSGILTLKFHPKFDESRIALYYVGKKNEISKSIFLSSFFEETFHYVVLHNAYVSGCTFYGLNSKTLIDFFPKYSWRHLGRDTQNVNMNTTVGYQTVVCPINAWPGSYGHWITDTIATLIYLPKQVWLLNPVLISNGPHPACEEQLQIFGLHNLTVIYPQNNFIFCENLYLLKAHEAVNGLGCQAVPLLRDKFADYYQLNSIKADKYGFMNKEYGPRHFTNLDEIAQNLTKEFGFPFEKLVINRPTLSSFYKILASLKILLSPNGSIIYNIIFMKKGTGIITLNTNYFDGPNVKLTYELEIWYVGILHHEMDQAPGPTNYSIVRHAFQVLLYAVEHKRWPATNLMVMFNVTLAQNCMKNVDDNANLNRILPQLFQNYMNRAENPQN